MLAGAITGQGRSAGLDAIAKVGVSPVESLGQLGQRLGVG
jgi:hypothetical protein